MKLLLFLNRFSGTDPQTLFTNVPGNAGVTGLYSVSPKSLCALCRSVVAWQLPICLGMGSDSAPSETLGVSVKFCQRAVAANTICFW